MPPNDKDSEWYATPQAKRHRKITYVTLSDDERAMLEEQAKQLGTNMSRIVAAAVYAFSKLGKLERKEAFHKTLGRDER